MAACPPPPPSVSPRCRPGARAGGRGRSRALAAGAGAEAVLAELPLPPLALLDAKEVATYLGYLLGAGSVLLYTPVGLRVLRQRQADGLSLSTWWFKVTGFCSSLLYATRKGFPLAQYADTCILTGETLLVLSVVAFFKRERREDPPGFDADFVACVALLAVALVVLSQYAPDEVLVAAQAWAVISQKGALVPQIRLNQDLRRCDYSPVTSALAVVGNGIRVFTTIQLAGGDPLLLFGFASGVALNGSLLAQALAFGRADGKSLAEIFAGDFADSDSAAAAGGSDGAVEKAKELVEK